MTLLKRLVKGVIAQLGSSVGWRMLSSQDKRLVVLMYHRVLPKTDERFRYEEPGMVVSPESFEKHIAELKQSQHPIVHLSDWFSTPLKQRPPLAFAITFDDGWLDNYEFAFPVLQRYDVPSTLFVVADFIGKPAPFWPNKILRLVLSKEDLSLPQYDPLRQLAPSLTDIKRDREGAAQLISALKQHTDEEIFAALSGVTAEREAIEMMNLDQIKNAVSQFNVEIGSHTKQHLRLNANLTKEQLTSEICESKTALEALLGQSVTGFCFPNGDYSSDALQLVQSQYEYAVTTHRGHNLGSTANAFELKRVGLHEDVSDSATKFRARVACWPN